MFRKPSDATLSCVSHDNFDDNTIIFPLARLGKVCYFGDVMFSYVQRNASTWNDMSIVKRVLVNQRDFFYELNSAPEYVSASRIRHSFELVRLGLFSKRSLLEQVGLVESLGLRKSVIFSKTWDALTSDDFVSRVCERLSLLVRYTPRAFVKGAACCSFLIKTRKTN